MKDFDIVLIGDPRHKERQKEAIERLTRKNRGGGTFKREEALSPTDADELTRRICALLNTADKP